MTCVLGDTPEWGPAPPTALKAAATLRVLTVLFGHSRLCVCGAMGARLFLAAGCAKYLQHCGKIVCGDKLQGKLNKVVVQLQSLQGVLWKALWNSHKPVLWWTLCMKVRGRIRARARA